MPNKFPYINVLSLINYLINDIIPFKGLFFLFLGIAISATEEKILVCRQSSSKCKHSLLLRLYHFSMKTLLE